MVVARAFNLTSYGGSCSLRRPINRAQSKSHVRSKNNNDITITIQNIPITSDLGTGVIMADHASELRIIEGDVDYETAKAKLFAQDVTSVIEADNFFGKYPKQSVVADLYIH